MSWIARRRLACGCLTLVAAFLPAVATGQAPADGSASARVLRLPNVFTTLRAAEPLPRHPDRRVATPASTARAVRNALRGPQWDQLSSQDGPAVQTSEAASRGARLNPWSVRFGYQGGPVLETSDFVKGNYPGGTPIDSVRAVRFEVSRRVDGSEEWHHSYRFPSYGVGLYYGDFDRPTDLGAPIAPYLFMSLPLVRFNDRVRLGTDYGVGVAFGFTPYDQETNPFNRAISTATTIYIDWGFDLKVALSPHWDINTGFSFTHFSNGDTRTPNLGLNTLAPRVAVAYHVANERPTFVTSPLSPFSRTWDVMVAVAPSWKGTTVPTSVSSFGEGDRQRTFGVFNATVMPSWHFFRNGKVQGGTDISYDGSGNVRLEIRDGRTVQTDAPLRNKMAVGVYGGYEQLFGPFSTYLHLGRYVWQGRTDDEVPKAYQRLGFRYAVGRRVSIGMGIRFFNFGRADFIEWTLGYSFGPAGS